MYIFTIKAKDAFGKNRHVSIKASNPEDALNILTEEGFRASLKDIDSVRKDSWLSSLQNFDWEGRFSQISKKDILRLVKMIGNSLKRGRTTKESLEFIGENEDSKALKMVITKLKARMEKPFTSQVEVFSIFPKYFDEEFLGIIQAGETSSNIGEYLIDYVEEKKKQMELIDKFRSVLMARLITLLMVVGVAIVVVAFVIPQFSQLFGDKMEIPWAMGALLGLSSFVKKFGIILVILLALGIASFLYLANNNSKFRWWWHDFLLTLPIFGKTLRTYYTAQFSYLLATLLTKSVDIITAMNIIIKQSNNVCMQATFQNIVVSMKGGDGLFTAITKENDEGRHYLISSIVQAAKIGGEVASLGETLMDVRNDLNELFVIRLERSIKGFSFIFYLFILFCALFIAYGIGSAIMAFYQNAQSLI